MRIGEAMDAASKPGSAVEFIVRALRQGIEQGSYAPGQRLVEPELSESLKVSRSSLREAFRSLYGERVIDIVPNRGAIARRNSTRDIRNIQQVRRVFEPLAASLAAAAILAGNSRGAERTMKAHIAHSDTTVLPADDLGTARNTVERTQVARSR